jgi:hypothetical protein
MTYIVRIDHGLPKLLGVMARLGDKMLEESSRRSLLNGFEVKDQTVILIGEPSQAPFGIMGGSTRSSRNRKTPGSYHWRWRQLDLACPMLPVFKG